MITHVHDTFKQDARKRARIEETDSHASLARAFLSEFTTDVSLLACVQNHDVPYSLFRAFERFGDEFDTKRLSKLLEVIPDLRLFTLFQIADNVTLGKIPQNGKPSPVEWFIDRVSEFLPAADHYRNLCKALTSKLKGS